MGTTLEIFHDAGCTWLWKQRENSLASGLQTTSAHNFKTRAGTASGPVAFSGLSLRGSLRTLACRKCTEDNVWAVRCLTRGNPQNGVLEESHCLLGCIWMQRTVQNTLPFPHWVCTRSQTSRREWGWQYCGSCLLPA